MNQKAKCEALRFDKVYSPVQQNPNLKPKKPEEPNFHKNSGFNAYNSLSCKALRPAKFTMHPSLFFPKHNAVIHRLPWLIGCIRNSNAVMWHCFHLNDS